MDKKYTIRQLLATLHATEITSNQRLPNGVYAGDFALSYVRTMLQKRNQSRRKKRDDEDTVLLSTGSSGPQLTSGLIDPYSKE